MQSDKHSFYSNLKVEDRLRLYGIQLNEQQKDATSDAYTSELTPRQDNQKSSRSRSRAETKKLVNQFLQRQLDHEKKSA